MANTTQIAVAALRPHDFAVKDNGTEFIFDSEAKAGLIDELQLPKVKYGCGKIEDGTKELGRKYFDFLLDNFLKDSEESRVAYDLYEKEQAKHLH